MWLSGNLVVIVNSDCGSEQSRLFGRLLETFPEARALLRALWSSKRTSTVCCSRALGKRQNHVAANDELEIRVKHSLGRDELAL